MGLVRKQLSATLLILLTLFHLYVSIHRTRLSVYAPKLLPASYGDKKIPTDVGLVATVKTFSWSATCGIDGLESDGTDDAFSDLYKHNDKLKKLEALWQIIGTRLRLFL